jgi:hypothetical protein
LSGVRAPVWGGSLDLSVALAELPVAVLAPTKAM